MVVDDSSPPIQPNYIKTLTTLGIILGLMIAAHIALVLFSRLMKNIKIRKNNVLLPEIFKSEKQLILENKGSNYGKDTLVTEFDNRK